MFSPVQAKCSVGKVQDLAAALDVTCSGADYSPHSVIGYKTALKILNSPIKVWVHRQTSIQ